MQTRKRWSVGGFLGLLVMVACTTVPSRVDVVPRALAQSTTQVHPNPDCQFFFSISTSGGVAPAATNGFDNRQTGCNVWSVGYNNSQFSALSFTFQTAANNGGTAGTWGTGFPVQQSIITGSNPASNTTGAFLWIIGANAFTRVQLTSATGSGLVSGWAFGWRIPSAQ